MAEPGRGGDGADGVVGGKGGVAGDAGGFGGFGAGGDGRGGGGGGGGAGFGGNGEQSTITVGSDERILGGKGGNGPSGGGGGGSGIGGGGGGGGFGGAGAGGGGQFSQGLTVNNSGTINGGSGSGDSGGGGGDGIGAGGHGAGVAGGDLRADWIVLSNNGTIRGGDGLFGGGGGVRGANVSIVNDGVIAGGINTNDGTRSKALIFTDGANSLTLGTNGRLDGDITIDSGSLTLEQTVNDATIASAIDGNGKVVKTGSATVLLTGTNSYTGGTTISAGTLQLGNGGATGSIVGNVVNDGTLAFNRSNEMSFAGIISGNGAVSQIGGGKTILTGTNNYNGGTTISAGTLQLGDGGATGSIVGNVVNDGTLAFNRSNEMSFAGIISGNGAVSQIGGGKTTLTGANSYAGGTTVSGGTLAVGNASALGADTGKTTVAGGVLSLGGLEVTQNGGVELRGGGIENGSLISSGTFDVQSGTISAWLDGSGRLNKTTSGTVILSEFNSYSGGTRISQGALKIGNSMALGSGMATLDGGTLSNLNGADQLVLGNLFTVTANGGTIDAGSGVTRNGRLYKGGLSLLNGISDGQTAGGKLTITGKAGESFVLFGASNSYSGPTEVTAGALLQAGAAGAFSRRSDFTVNGDLQLNGIDQTVRSLSGTGTVANSGVDPATLTIDMPSGEATFGGRITDGAAGPLALVKTGAGTQVLSGWENDYSGGTTISQGALLIDGLPGSGTVTLDGGTLGNAVENTGMVLENDFAITANGGTLALKENNGFTLAGNITDGATGGGTLTIAGVSDTSVVLFAGDSSYSGDTDITGGRLIFTNGLRGLGTHNLGGNVHVQEGAELVVFAPATLTIAKGLTLADGAALSMQTSADAQPLRANAVTIGQGVTFNLSGINDASGLDKVLLDTGSGISGDFATVNVGGFSGTVDYLTLNTRKSADNLQYLASYDLSWTANNNLAHGTFTLADATDSFDVGAVLGDQGANAESGWDGRSLTKAGAGTLILSGNNSYTGGTTIAAGTLQIGNGGTTGSIVGDVVNNGVLAFNRSNEMSFTGTISGNGSIRQIGTGTTILSGDSAVFAGTTTIAAGRLIVGSDKAHAGAVLGGSLDVGNGGLLGGHGTVGAGVGSTVTVASGGTIAPGNSIGSFTVNGDLLFKTGSHFLVEVDPEGTASDMVKVTGKATIDGGLVTHIGAAGNYKLRSTYTILSAEHGLTGRFDGVTSDFAFLTPDLAYDYSAGTVDLTLARNNVAFASAAGTRNQFATGTAIDSIGIDAGSPVHDAIAQLPDDKSLIRGAFDQLSGEIHASTKTVLIEDSRFVREAATDRIRAAFGDIGASSAPVMAYGPEGVSLAPATTDRLAFWGYGYGVWGNRDGDGNAAGLHTATGGFLAGVDAPIFDSWRIGVLAGYSHTSFDARDRASGDSDNYHLGLYGGASWDVPGGSLGLRSGLAYSWHDIDTARRVGFPGFSDSLKANHDAGTFQAFGDLGYKIDKKFATVEPFASLAYVNLDTDGFTEQGGAAALHASGQSTDTTFTTLGLRLVSGFDLGGITATARGSIGWRHAFGNTTPLSTQAFQAGNAFTIAGVPIARNAAVIEAGLDVPLTTQATLGLFYTGQLAGDSRQHGFKANLSVRF